VNAAFLHKPSNSTTSNSTSQPQTSKVCFLKTAVATIRAGAHQTQANVLLDDGAQRSFISQDLASQLKLTTQGKECVAISPFGASEASNQTLPITTIFLKTTDGGEIPISVLVVPKISQPLRNLPFSYVKELPYLKGIRFIHAISDNQEFNISVLIGADFYWSIVQETVIRGPGPTTVQSKLGYLLSGPLNLSNHSQEITNAFHVSVSPNIEQIIEKFWTIESTGTFPTSLQSYDQFTDDYLASIVQENNGSYVVKFPWKNNHAPLPSNFKICECRTRALARHLSNTPDLLRVYNDIIKEQERRGFIEKIDSSPPTGPVHYIPHHHVNKDSKTTPIRIVYDCSC